MKENLNHRLFIIKNQLNNRHRCINNINSSLSNKINSNLQLPNFLFMPLVTLTSSDITHLHPPDPVPARNRSRPLHPHLTPTLLTTLITIPR